MKGSNKFLFSIVISIILLVVITFSLVLWRPKPAYQDEHTPGGVAHNYLLALQQGDYARAYGYLPATFNYPTDADKLADEVRRNAWYFNVSGNASLAVEAVELRGVDEAVVTVRKTIFYSNRLMSSYNYSQTFTMRLVQEGGTWKVIKADDYWSNCWGTSQVSRCP